MILVTGGTGLLGSHLLLDLLRSGKKVRATRRAESDLSQVRKVFSYYTPDADELAGRIEWVEADLLDPGDLEEALKGVTEIYHAGALVSFHPGDHRRMLKTNIEGTANLVNMAIASGISKFCHISSVATLGRAENRKVSDEETYWVPSGKNSVYSISKYGGEREVWRGMEEGLNAVIVNPSVILGPGFWNENSRLFRLVHEGLRYYPNGVNGYVDVRDVSRALTGLMDGGHFGQRFICSAGNLSYRELFSMMAKHLGRPAPSIGVSPFMAAIAWRTVKLRALLTGSRPVITREMATTASQVYEYSSGKLTKTLGFAFRPLEDSIREICTLFFTQKM
jgi:nucleoside-diphosphate-sugar epimerase